MITIPPSLPPSLPHLAQEAEVVSELVLGVRPQGLLHHLVLAHEEAEGGRDGGREGGVSALHVKPLSFSLSARTNTKYQIFANSGAIAPPSFPPSFSLTGYPATQSAHP